MDFKWIIQDNHVALKCNSTIMHPNAEEVFGLINKTEYTDIDDVCIPPIKEAFCEIKFSGIGVPIKCRIENYDSNSISVKLFCLKFGKEIPIDFVGGQIIDHCIIDNTWFYVNGNVDGLNTVFQELNIVDPQHISIRQYVGLIRRIKDIGKNTLSNVVDWKKLNKDLPTDAIMPEGLKANLYEYQKSGFFWMQYMLQQNQGCILGDEMGLGKTLQIIALFQYLKNQGKSRNLVVAPVSLLQNWKNECKKFAPNLEVKIHHGAQRSGFYKELEDFDVVVVAYSTVITDASMLSMIDWELVVLDEAQNIKNPVSKRTKFVKKIPRKMSVAVTGTPFENHVSDIWSIMDFAIPGLLGTLSEFNSLYSDDITGAEELEPFISPIILRRTVNEVARDLPEKIVISQPLAMSETEAFRYEELRKECSESYENGKIGLESIQRLRMFCTNPIVCGYGMSKDPFKESIKYQRFCEILENIISSREKVIVFTSFNSMFDIMQADIKKRFNVEVETINGSTPVEERQTIVDNFNSARGSKVLLLNPRAAGTGLNITSANHVIHYNLEWNPALEDQASARAYRRGQEKTVFIYRLYYENTVEQIINERIEKKRGMSESAIVGTDGGAENKEAIIRAMLMSPIGNEV